MSVKHLEPMLKLSYEEKTGRKIGDVFFNKGLWGIQWHYPVQQYCDAKNHGNTYMEFAKPDSAFFHEFNNIYLNLGLFT